MIVTIDTDIIGQLGISPNEFCLIFLLYNDCKNTIEASAEMILNLEAKGFIKDQEDGIILRKKALDLFSKPVTSIPDKQNELESFVEKYRSLFPQGVKSGNRLVKGDKHGCLSKLKNFKLKYPEYSQDEILEATKVYIDLCRKRNYDKMTSADYFVEKDKVSMLAGYLEDIRVRGINVKEAMINTGIGRTKAI